MKKNIVILVAVMIAAALGVSGTMLLYYGRVLTNVQVEQSIQLEGEEGWLSCSPGNADCTLSDNVWEVAPGGEKFCFKHKLRNRMSVNGTVDFATFYTPDGEGISTAYYGVDGKTTIVLENKDADWKVINDNTKATLTYDTVNPTFDFTLGVEALQPQTEYVLIYYADFDPRFALWGGNNPGALIKTFTTDASGNADVTSNVELGMNLPAEPDWNINPSPDYCDNHNGKDDYDHCKGAKFWIVPKTDFDGSKVTNWNPTAFLFETDLGVYFDCNLGVDEYLASLVGEPVNGFTIGSDKEQDFLICHSFDEKIVPGTYQIETRIV